ncbi:MAG: 50S ribosomal protein L35 [Candidatus Omnitrophica bacterium]|nr:50S ribosomal protein L35 [Candidatus Omnitrophota bacterium]
MPKLKTRKGVKKRFSFSGKNKIKRDQANKGHLKSSKNSKRKRQLRNTAIVHKSEEKMIRTLMPYE